MSKIVFTREQTFQFINEVHQRPCIWNPNDANYNKRKKVAKAWVDISAKMDNASVPFLRTKWKYLRDTYKKELNKAEVSLDNYSGPWRYYKHLTFLVFKNGNDLENTENEDSNTDVSSNAEIVIKREPSMEFEVHVPEKRSIEGEFDVLFLHSLAPYFKQLDPIRKLVVRSKMQDMLFNEIVAQNSGRTLDYNV